MTVVTSSGVPPAPTPTAAPEEVPIPDVTNKSSKDAIAQLTAAGFSSSNITFDYKQDNNPANTCKVKSSNPKPQTPTSKSAAIVLTLNSPTGAAPTPACPTS